MNLDEKMKMLESISKQLESEDTSLEVGVKLFEQSVEIAKDCIKSLNDTKGKMIQIKQELESYKEEEMK